MPARSAFPRTSEALAILAERLLNPASHFWAATKPASSLSSWHWRQTDSLPVPSIASEGDLMSWLEWQKTQAAIPFSSKFFFFFEPRK